MWGFVVAMREIAEQATVIDGRPPVLWHAASSGGTSAGIGWAVDRLGLAMPVVACSIGDSASQLAAKVSDIWEAAASETGATVPAIAMEFNDDHIGGGYGLVSDDDLRIQAEATSLTGLIFDPTYTGKALAGLRREVAAGRFEPEDNVIFWHTGGGFAVFAHDFSRTVAAGDQASPLS
jgi:1-aminocyclopropane-1-carboxylate deaminase/D-cysteine desulfhydrase-like pyridoxal-dependent ACC family enzyme